MSAKFDRMDSTEDMFPEPINERIERLICRHLDGEISGEVKAELDAALKTDPSARALFEEYARNDRLAAEALHSDFEFAMVAAESRQRRGLRLAAAAVALAAAAVILISILPRLGGPGPGSNIVKAPSDLRVQPMQQFVEYRNDDFRPRRRELTTWRDVIGFRDQDDENVIYILERNRRSERIVPVSSDF